MSQCCPAVSPGSGVSINPTYTETSVTTLTVLVVPVVAKSGSVLTSSGPSRRTMANAGNWSPLGNVYSWDVIRVLAIIAQNIQCH